MESMSLKKVFSCRDGVCVCCTCSVSRLFMLSIVCVHPCVLCYSLYYLLEGHSCNQHKQSVIDTRWAEMIWCWFVLCGNKKLCRQDRNA